MKYALVKNTVDSVYLCNLGNSNIVTTFFARLDMTSMPLGGFMSNPIVVSISVAKPISKSRIENNLFNLKINTGADSYIHMCSEMDFLATTELDMWHFTGYNAKLVYAKYWHNNSNYITEFEIIFDHIVYIH